MTAELTAPDPAAVDERPIAWERVRSSAEGRIVTVFYWSGVEPCHVLDRVDIRTSAARITITLYEGRLPSSEDVACIEMAVYRATRLHLDEPVGDREIVDGAAA